MAREAGGYGEGAPVSMEVKEDVTRAPEPIVHPVIFKDETDRDYLAILTHIRAAGRKLHEIKRFDMPGFKPNEHYVREMRRFGILPASFNVDRDAINVYDTDSDYWASLWHKPHRPSN